MEGAAPSAPIMESETLNAIRSSFKEAMDDDFNTAEAIGKLHEAVKEVNIFIQYHPSMDDNQKRSLQGMVDLIRELGGVLGLFQQSEDAAGTADDNIVNDLMEVILEIRNACRTKKDWALADQIRSLLQEKGITIEDRKEGTVWKRK